MSSISTEDPMYEHEMWKLTLKKSGVSNRRFLDLNTRSRSWTLPYVSNTAKYIHSFIHAQKKNCFVDIDDTTNYVIASRQNMLWKAEHCMTSFIAYR